jgi:hypothetical protein
MGWSIAINALIAIAIISALVFTLAWKAKAHGYED